MNYKKIQEMEAKSWRPESPEIFRDKSIREVIRYPLLKKQMGLEHLDTSWMEVWDIGCGPLGGVSTVVNCKKVVRVDPLRNEYAKDYTVYGEWLDDEAEELNEKLGKADLIIITNAMDHFKDPTHFLKDLVKYMKPGAFLAHFHAVNNAYTHKHPAHEHNLNPEIFKEHLSKDFEVCWYLDNKNDGLTYGWLKQPAFCGLYRKTTGYAK
jgi:2-polyprenyl-3-methyl-5-hydroxy-6-metoxy-1,4-benzoquinol methylase